MPHSDSIDKIVTVYLAGVCSAQFSYKGKIFVPKPLVVSPLIFRGFTCPEFCGGCCPRFTLDYLPSDKLPYEVEERWIEVDGRRIKIMSDLQKDNSDHHCRNLDKTNGRCGIYQQRPFSCDFELIRFITFPDKAALTQRLFGRGWAMKRIDGNRGALCQMLKPDQYTISEVSRKLRRLLEWADHLGIETELNQIIAWSEAGPWETPLHIQPKQL